MKAARTLFPNMILLTAKSISIISILCLAPGLDARCHKANCLQCEHGTCTKCLYGWYGADCSLRCVSCQSDGCEQLTGRCIKCSPGFYGDSCNISCPMNCYETNYESYRGATFCNRSTGQCLEGCKKSFWGSQCDKYCSRNCLESVCEQKTGDCIKGCIDGFYGFECNKRCPQNCNKNCSLDDCTITVTKSQSINDVRDGLVAQSKYASLACRNSGYRWYGSLLTLVVIKLLD